MAANPATVGMLISGAVQIGSTVLGMKAARQQQKNEIAMIEAETERAKLEASDEALVKSQNFRQALSSQLAISSLRGGTGGSLVRQFGASSVSNFLQDQNIIDRRKDFIDIASSSNIAQTRANRFAKDVSAIGGLVKTGVESLNFNAFKKSAKT